MGWLRTVDHCAVVLKLSWTRESIGMEIGVISKLLVKAISKPSQLEMLDEVY